MKKKVASGLYASIDIGSTSVKAVVVEVTDKNKRLLKAESEPLNPANSFGSEEEYNQHVSEAITKLVKSLELDKCKKISSLYNSRELQVKLIDLPNQVTVDQLDSVLVWEAKKLLSSHYKDQEFAFAYSVIKENPITVALAVIPQILLEQHLYLFENSGIKPESVYSDVFTADALRPIVDLAGLPALSIVNFGYTGSHLQIFSTGKLKFYRFIPSGVAEMSDPPTESELEMYSQKIRFSFDYFRAVSKLSQVDTMYFMGGGSQFKEVIPYAQNYFSPTKVYPLDISSAIDISPVISSVMNENTTAQDSSSGILRFIPAIGACLTDLSEKAEHANLMTQLNYAEKEKQKEKLAQSLPIFFGIAAIIISAVILGTMYTQRDNVIKEYEQQATTLSAEKDAYKIKLASRAPKEPEHNMKLCANSQKVVEPAIQNKRALHTLFSMIMRLREPGMKITDILIRNRQEADQIVLKAEVKDIFGEGFEDVEEDKLAPFTSKFSSTITEDQIKEDFDGKIAIIRGIAENTNQVSKFTEGLSVFPTDSKGKKLPRAIKRVLSISTQKISGNKVEFMMKGELK